MAQDRAAEAEKLIESEKEKDPKEIAYWVALADLAIRDNRWERARQTLDEAEKKLGDQVALRLTRAQYLVRKGEKDAAEQIRKLAEKSKDFSTPDQVRLWRELAAASLAVDDFPQAERLFRLVMAELPGDLRVRLELFDLAAQAHDLKLMDTALKEIRGIESEGPIWHYASALSLIFSESAKLPAPSGRGAAGELPSPSGRGAGGEGGLSSPDQPSDLRPPTSDPQRQAVLRQAQEHLAAALRLRPNWSRALMLQGMIYEELHEEDAALAKYLEAVNQGETGAEIARRALRLLYGKGQYAAANALLRQLESQKVPFTTELFRQQSRVLGGMQDYAGALKSARQAAATSKDYRDYLWLGQLLSILGQNDEAEKALEQASQLDEKAPETWVAQVQFFVLRVRRSGRKRPSRWRGKIPAAEAPLALAECLELLGKTDEAAQQYALAPQTETRRSGHRPQRSDLLRAAARPAQGGRATRADRQRPDSRHASAACRRPRCPGPCPRRSGRVSEPAGGDPPGRPELGGIALLGRRLASEGPPSGHSSPTRQAPRGGVDLREAGRRAAEHRGRRPFPPGTALPGLGRLDEGPRPIAGPAGRARQPAAVRGGLRAGVVGPQGNGRGRALDRSPGADCPRESPSGAAPCRSPVPRGQGRRGDCHVDKIRGEGRCRLGRSLGPHVGRRRRTGIHGIVAGQHGGHDPPPPRRRRPKPSIGSISRRIPSRAWSWSVFSAVKSGWTRPCNSWKRRRRPPNRHRSPRAASCSCVSPGSRQPKWINWPNYSPPSSRSTTAPLRSCL